MRWIWIGLLVAACSTTSGQKVEQISSKELSDMLDDRDVQLIDVRTPEEVSYGKIAGARHIDFYDPQFVSEINKLDKEKPVVVYCAVGGRSAQAATSLEKLGFEQVHDLSGGIRGWKKEGYPVVTE